MAAEALEGEALSLENLAWECTENPVDAIDCQTRAVGMELGDTSQPGHRALNDVLPGDPLLAAFDLKTYYGAHGSGTTSSAKDFNNFWDLQSDSLPPAKVSHPHASATSTTLRHILPTTIGFHQSESQTSSSLLISTRLDRIAAIRQQFRKSFTRTRRRWSDTQSLIKIDLLPENKI